MATEDNQMTGFIALYRSLRNHWVWEDPIKLKWWLDILLEVNHKDKKVSIGSSIYTCGRGQSMNSLTTWGKRWGVAKSTVKRFLDMLKNDGMIRIESVKKTTRITVCKYDSYNNTRNDSETIAKRKRNVSETQTKPNNNVNNVNNGNKKGDSPPSLEEVTAYFEEKGYTKESAIKAFDFYDVANWVDSKGNEVKNWKQKMINVWFRDENKKQFVMPSNRKKL